MKPFMYFKLNYILFCDVLSAYNIMTIFFNLFSVIGVVNHNDRKHLNYNLLAVT